jgi:hypothetical protein
VAQTANIQRVSRLCDTTAQTHVFSWSPRERRRVVDGPDRPASLKRMVPDTQWYCGA